MHHYWLQNLIEGFKAFLERKVIKKSITMRKQWDTASA